MAKSELYQQLMKDYRRQEKRAHPVRRFFKWLFVLSLFMSILPMFYIWHCWQTAPKLKQVFPTANASLSPGVVNVRYLNSEGKVFYHTNDSNFESLAVSDIDKMPNVVHALLATEDRDFYHEHGVNLKRTALASVNFIKARGTAINGGGSTITQQLIKLTYFSTSAKDQTIKRKLQEIKLAWLLDKRYTKNEILRWYFNKVSFGNSQQGLKAASAYYYGCSPDKLTVLQAATLVGMINAPSRYNPYIHKTATKNRRNLVLKAMQSAHYISKSTYQILSKKPIDLDLRLAKDNVQTSLELRAQKLQYSGFVSGVDTQLRRYDAKLLNHSIVIQTTMNQALQDQVNDIVNKQVYPDDNFQEAIVVLDNKTGDVLALSGGRNVSVLGAYNRVFNAVRSSGSAIKPLLDYAPLFETKGWSANTKVADTAMNYPGTNIAINDWDHKYQGNITVRQALVQSRNIPAVKALETLGLTNANLVTQALGFGNLNLYYANAIGLDTNPLALASAYSALANNGVRSNARFMTKLTNADNGRILSLSSVQEPVFSAKTANDISNILTGVFSGNGTATAAKLDGINQAGKTGTVGRNDKDNALTDAWMVGYTRSYTVAVWVGYDNPNDSKDILTNDKSKVAQSLYKSVMRAAMSLPNSDNGLFMTKNSGRTGNYLSESSRIHAKLPAKPLVGLPYFYGSDDNPQAGVTKLIDSVN